MDLLHQLGDLFLAAVPTAILVFLFYFFLRWSFFRPLLKVLADRQARIEGSRKDAESLTAASREKQRAYREGLRKARDQVFAEQESARRVVLEERGKLIRQARSRAGEEVQAAKARLANEVEAARKVLETSGEQLAEELVRAILEPAGGAR
jgi:F0F1-type ATP synthase membrane subunit b/b'